MTGSGVVTEKNYRSTESVKYRSTERVRQKTALTQFYRYKQNNKTRQHESL